MISFFLITVILLSSCQFKSWPSQDDSHFKEQIFVVENPTTAAHVPETEEVVNSHADAISHSQMLCRDDLYVQYLVDQYKKEHQHRVKRQTTAFSSRLLQQQVELEAFEYARRKMQGSEDTSFGELPVVHHPRVEFWLKYFKATGRETFMLWLARAESIRAQIQPLLRQEGLPEQIFYLGMIESGFNFRAFSSASATGPWQFMKGTAAIYGMRMDYWVDERRDLQKSTIAAARYIRDMYARFDDWWLAMAAYNAGPGRISGAIRKTGAKDYWRISETRYISKETKHYVPKVIAAMMIASAPKDHGFDVRPVDVELLPQGHIVLKDTYRLNDIAAPLGINPDHLKLWNPELIRGVIPPSIRNQPEGYALRVPAALVPSLTVALEQHIRPVRISDVTLYKVQSGDTLSTIAHRHGLKLSQITGLNPGLRAKSLTIGKQLALPVPAINEVVY